MGTGRIGLLCVTDRKLLIRQERFLDNFLKNSVDLEMFLLEQNIADAQLNEVSHAYVQVVQRAFRSGMLLQDEVVLLSTTYAENGLCGLIFHGG